MSAALSGKANIYLNCCTNMHDLIKMIKNDQVQKRDITKILENTLIDMDRLANDENFLVDDEEDELEDMLPEIKDWIESTFTGAPGKSIRKSARPRFKVVVNAILAMQMVEKIFKQSNENAAMNIPPAVSKMLQNNINDWDFDVMALDMVSENRTLRFLTIFLFMQHDILRKYKVTSDLLEEFLNELQIGYSKNSNPYYNSLHSADVVQTIHYFIQTYKLSHWLTDMEVFVLLFSAVIHGHDDPGVSNSFLVKTNSQLALLYNDIQVKENHNISSVFKILQNPKCNFLRALNKNDYGEFRRMVIECILNVDCTLHTHQIKSIKVEIGNGYEMNKLKIMQFLLHAADISHPTKVWALHNKWVTLWQEQMFKQGDLEYELNIPYSPLCSRKVSCIEDIQLNFLTYIVEPTFQLVGNIFDTLKPQFSLSRSSSDMGAATPNLMKKSSTSSGSKIHPWVNKIVLNKSMWQRKIQTRYLGD